MLTTIRKYIQANYIQLSIAAGAGALVAFWMTSTF